LYFSGASVFLWQFGLLRSNNTDKKSCRIFLNNPIFPFSLPTLSIKMLVGTIMAVPLRPSQTGVKFFKPSKNNTTMAKVKNAPAK